MFAVLGVTLGVTALQANRTADAALRRVLGATRRAVDEQLAARTRALARASALAAEIPQYRERLLDQRDRSEALEQADQIRDLVGAAWVLVTTREGMLIARTDYREQYDRDLSVTPLVANALSGGQTSGAWLDDMRGTMYIAVGTPLRDRPGTTPRGALVAGYQLEDSLARAVKQTADADVVFFALDTLDRPLIVGTTLPAADLAGLGAAVDAAALAADSAAAGLEVTLEVGGRRFAGVAAPIRSPGGDVRGGFIALRSGETELAGFAALRRAVALAAGVGVVLALLFAAVEARLITARRQD